MRHDRSFASYALDVQTQHLCGQKGQKRQGRQNCEKALVWCKPQLIVCTAAFYKIDKHQRPLLAPDMPSKLSVQVEKTHFCLLQLQLEYSPS